MNELLTNMKCAAHKYENVRLTNMKACLQFVNVPSLPFYSSYSSTAQLNENRLLDF